MLSSPCTNKSHDIVSTQFINVYHCSLNHFLRWIDKDPDWCSLAEAGSSVEEAANSHLHLVNAFSTHTDVHCIASVQGPPDKVLIAEECGSCRLRFRSFRLCDEPSFTQLHVPAFIKGTKQLPAVKMEQTWSIAHARIHLCSSGVPHTPNYSTNRDVLTKRVMSTSRSRC